MPDFEELSVSSENVPQDLILWMDMVTKLDVIARAVVIAITHRGQAIASQDFSAHGANTKQLCFELVSFDFKLLASMYVVMIYLVETIY